MARNSLWEKKRRWERKQRRTGQRPYGLIPNKELIDAYRMRARIMDPEFIDAPANERFTRTVKQVNRINQLKLESFQRDGKLVNMFFLWSGEGCKFVEECEGQWRDSMMFASRERAKELYEQGRVRCTTPCKPLPLAR